MAKRRQNTILVKVPGPEDSQEGQESGSEASDSVSNGDQSGNAQNGQNVTLITLNSEGIATHITDTHRNSSLLVFCSNYFPFPFNTNKLLASFRKSAQL